MTCAMNDKTHTTPIGYDQHAGCGARFTHIRHYIGGGVIAGYDMNARLRDMTAPVNVKRRAGRVA
jgi:hypothetical protein